MNDQKRYSNGHVNLNTLITALSVCREVETDPRLSRLPGRYNVIALFFILCYACKGMRVNKRFSNRNRKRP